MENNSVFVEKQYLGRDYGRISVRLVMALFCFAAYIFTEDNEKAQSDLFLVAGFGILIVSVLMIFLLHYRITVKNNSVIIDGIWTSRMIKIDLNSIVSVERVPYSTYMISNPVYNLHKKGTIRFYAGGKDAVQLTDRDGLRYIIGTQHSVELVQTIKSQMGGR